ncbi:MAG: hypothetical protein ACO3XL_01540 [Gemmobacter sp.]
MTQLPFAGTVRPEATKREVGPLAAGSGEGSSLMTTVPPQSENVPGSARLFQPPSVARLWVKATPVTGTALGFVSVMRRSSVSPPWIHWSPMASAMLPVRSRSVAASVACAEAPLRMVAVCMSPPPAS